MSRSTKLIFITFIVLALLFSAYLFLAPQPSITHRTNTLTPATRRSTTSPTGSLGQGEGAWVKQFDVNTGRLASQFRGQQYERQPDNTVRVASPEAEFYLSDGQVLRIHGKTGIIAVPDSLRPGRDQYFSGPSKPPTRGDLKSVVITLLKDANSTTPTLTCVMDNATFDNETFRIYTQDATIDGKPVPADQIPVSLRGEDYDFDGRGLTIRLNQRDRRLEYLEITHGHHLTIKNPSNIDDRIPSPRLPAARLAPALPEMYASAGPVFPPSVLAQAGPGRRRRAATRPSASTTTAPAPPAIYRANFQDNVRVTQANEDLAKGDQLQIDFLFDDAPKSTTRTATTEPAPAPSRHPESSEEPQPAQPAPAPTPRGTGDSPVSPSPATAPTTRPAQPPVTIWWSGKLTLHPIPTSDDAPTARNSIVRVMGSPLNVRQGPSTITGTALIYRTATQHLSLRGSDQHRLTLSDGKGAVVHGTAIDYLQQERLATLDGPGSATKILPAEAPDQPAREMTTKWSRSATLFFTGQADEPLHIETANLAGAVSVQHPQLQLTAETLKLAFDPTPATRPSTRQATGDDPQSTPDFSASDLRRLDAAGSVKATVLTSNNRPQSIAADKLTLDTASTPDGRIYPKTLVADGNVVAQDPDQQLRAGHLKTTLLPAPATPQSATRKSTSDTVPIELESLTATDNVAIQTADGVKVSATRLDVTVDPATRAQHVRLLGSPAHVASKENSVTGPFIEIFPATEQYVIRGPGQMHLLQRETPQAKPRPVDVTWKDSVTVDGKRNLITVLGSVGVASLDDNGTRSNANGQHLEITLADAPKPTTARATTSATTKKSAPLTGIASAGDPMQNKTVQTITFKQGATIESVQTDRQTNDLLRQMNVIADVVSYDLPNKRVIIPVPGRMLFVNRAATTKPAAGADANNIGGSRGNTAFAWTRDMVFDQSANVMTMTGEVVIAHEPDGGDRAFRLDAEKVTAYLAARPSTQRATNNTPQATPDSVDLKRVTAEGSIQFTGKDIQLSASSVEYDPSTGILIARGQGRDPVRLFDPDGVQIGAAREVHFNAKTGQDLRLIDAQAQTRRKF